LYAGDEHDGVDECERRTELQQLRDVLDGELRDARKLPDEHFRHDQLRPGRQWERELLHEPRSDDRVGERGISLLSVVVPELGE